MKINKYIFVLILTLSTFTACEFGDTNIDPTRPADAPLNLVLPSIQAQMAYNQVANPGRTTGLVMQYFAGLDAQQLAYQNYNITEIEFNNYWRTGFYAALLNNCKAIIDKANAENNPYYAGIAKVVQANGLGMTTAMFGDIPFSEAIQGSGNLKPTYDTQEQVFTTIQSILDDAISDLSTAAYTSPAPPASDDLVFGGDASKWIATARALKARYHITLSRRNTSAAASALAAINAGAISSAANEPGYPFETAQNGANPYFLFGQQRPNTLGVRDVFVSTLTANSDPRASALYVLSGDGTPFYYQSGNTDLYWSQANAVVPIISYEEVKFIEAEALLRTNASDANVLAAMEAGIRANMTKLGVSTADADTYVTARVNFTGLTTLEQKLEKLIGEKYVCLYGQGHIEAWTDYRRTGYPALTPVNSNGGGLNPGNQIPRRYIYPISERQTNEVNVEAAKTRQGGDLMNVHLWAFEP